MTVFTGEHWKCKYLHFVSFRCSANERFDIESSLQLLCTIAGSWRDALFCNWPEDTISKSTSFTCLVPPVLSHNVAYQWWKLYWSVCAFPGCSEKAPLHHISDSTTIIISAKRRAIEKRKACIFSFFWGHCSLRLYRPDLGNSVSFWKESF